MIMIIEIECGDHHVVSGSYQGDAKGLQQARFSLDGKVDTTYT